MFDLIKIKWVITSQIDQLITIKSIHKVTPNQNGHFTSKKIQVANLNNLNNHVFLLVSVSVKQLHLYDFTCPCKIM